MMATEKALKGRPSVHKKKFDELGILIVAIALFIFLSIASPHFLKFTNIQNLLLQSVFVMLVGFGMTFVLTIGGIDLSVGSILGFSGATCGLMIIATGSAAAGVLTGLVTGVGFGFLNGILITKLKIAPFLVTFAMNSVIRGILLLTSSNGSVSGFGIDDFTWLSQGYAIGLPVPVIITIIVFVILLFLFKFTSFGRYITAIGSNKQAAFLSGVSTNRITVIVYMLSGLMAALSGVLLAARMSSVPSELGAGYEMDAIAAAVIGGTSMAGGKGSIIGAIIGAMILGMISNGLDLLSVNQFYRQIIVGIIIVVAVALERLTSLKSEKV
ncbi:ABC transporter permease [Christensenellaceae bacterium OttesenSCG-928-K19]|nr:ABC transporter permease [Christensenellaceae bacterium OttesenSCG-928-K19]